MLNYFATYGKIYSDYANVRLPWNDLHAYSAKLASAPDGQANAIAEVAAPIPLSRAKLYAYRAAVVPHHIMRLPDAMFGTGLNQQSRPVNITNGCEAVAHISECIRSPLDSGLMGTALGLTLLLQAGKGAIVGALLGAVVCASPKSIDICAATGAVLSVALVTAPALWFAGMNGIMRAGTSLAKFAVVGAFYGAGYAVGALLDRLLTVQA